MKRILINTTQSEELRVAMVNGQLLYDLDIEVPSREQKKSNIYKGIITRVEPSLEAAFVNYGAERHGFLPFKEISRNYFGENAKDDKGRYNIKDAIKVGQELIVQVEKEERGNKGAALTSFVSLAGRFLVAMPQNPRAGGVSRRIEGEDRDQVRKVMSELNMPTGMGIIARTAGVGRTTEEMQWDLDYLTQLWTAIEQASSENSAPFLIYQESDIVIRALRDHYKSDVGEVYIDSKKAYDRAHEFMSMVMPNAVHKLKHFDEKQPLFNRFQIENQIESAFNRTVNLPSGGAIVIDHTEALISIDINSARATKGGDIEETALNTNLEAADEVARQLRIRDLGGLVVIDFIDMMKNKNQRDVEQRLRKAVYDDRARVQIGRISRFGLLEMSRQRLRPSLGESSQIVCPRCSGQGTIRDIESLSLSVLRLLEEEALKEGTRRILAKLPVECATYLLNEKRSKIAGIEERNNVHTVIIPDPNLETPHFHIERVRDNDTLRHESSYKSSYELTTEEAPGYTPETKTSAPTPVQTPVIQQIAPPTPKPKSAPAPSEKESGLISKVISAIFGGAEKEEPKEPVRQNKPNRSRRTPNRNRNRPNQNRSKQNRTASRPQNPKHKADTKQAAQPEDGNKPQQETSETRQRPQKSTGNRSRNRNPNRRNQGQNRQKSEQAQQQGENKPATQQATKADNTVKESTSPATDIKNQQPSQQAAEQKRASPVTAQENTAHKPAPESASSSQPDSPKNKHQQDKPQQPKPAVEKPVDKVSKAPAERKTDKPAADKPVVAKQSPAESKTPAKTPAKPSVPAAKSPSTSEPAKQTTEKSNQSV